MSHAKHNGLHISYPMQYFLGIFTKEKIKKRKTVNEIIFQQNLFHLRMMFSKINREILPSAGLIRYLHEILPLILVSDKVCMVDRSLCTSKSYTEKLPTG